MTFRQSTHRNLCNLSSKRSRSHDPVLCAGRGITRVMAVVEARPASVASEASVMLAARPLSSARSFSVAPVIVNSRHLPRASCSLVCDATTNLNDIRRQQQQQRRQVYRPKTTHTSSSSFLYEGYADSPADLMEMMRRIVRRGGIGRKQDNVPKEVVKVFCERYSELTEAGKEELLLSLARDFTPNKKSVEAAVGRYANAAATERAVESSTWKENGGADRRRESGHHVKAYERLREELLPAYEALFRNVVAESDDGVRFVVDLRRDLLELMKRGRRGTATAAAAEPLLAALDGSLRSLLQAWFSVGFLELRRITYEASGGALLEKISRFEAVHPVRSLSELKRRLGSSRRCFAFFHPCLPEEPLVFVHIALLPNIAGSMEEIGSCGSGDHHIGSGGGSREVESGGKQRQGTGMENNARCAIFYSISSTQKGLQGVQLGNFLIKRVVTQLRVELPQLETFATLSPIPSFRDWLSKKARHRAALGVDRSELSGERLLTSDEAVAILSVSTGAADGGDGSGDVNTTQSTGRKASLQTEAETEQEQEAREVQLEARAMAVLLSSDGAPTAAWVSNAKRDENDPGTEVSGPAYHGNVHLREDENRGDEDGDGAAAAVSDLELETAVGGLGVNDQSDVTGKERHAAVAARKATEKALTRLAARYLVRETVRGKIPDPVGNFHISNGARLERVNWLADCSSRGIENSFGLMVNYVYDPSEIESNNRLYLSRGEVPASGSVRNLAYSLRESGQNSEDVGKANPLTTS